jgi:hypothetical protein
MPYIRNHHGSNFCWVPIHASIKKRGKGRAYKMEILKLKN